jgi:hypothetical protein
MGSRDGAGLAPRERGSSLQAIAANPRRVHQRFGGGRCEHAITNIRRRRQPDRSSCQRAAEKPALLFCFDPRSGRSLRVDGTLAQVLQHRHNHDTFRIYRIDVTEHPDWATKFAIGAVPTLVVVEEKRVKGRFEQPRGSRELTHFL